MKRLFHSDIEWDKMKTDIVAIVQIKFVSVLDYSFNNYIVGLCERLEHSHSPLVDIICLCTGDTTWLFCDSLRERTPGSDPVNHSMVQTSLCSTLKRLCFMIRHHSWYTLGCVVKETTQLQSVGGTIGSTVI